VRAQRARRQRPTGPLHGHEALVRHGGTVAHRPDTGDEPGHQTGPDHQPSTARAPTSVTPDAVTTRRRRGAMKPRSRPGSRIVRTVNRQQGRAVWHRSVSSSPSCDRRAGRPVGEASTGSVPLGLQQPGGGRPSTVRPCGRPRALPCRTGGRHPFRRCWCRPPAQGVTSSAGREDLARDRRHGAWGVREFARSGMAGERGECPQPPVL
jgi:hypothetical protein